MLAAVGCGKCLSCAAALGGLLGSPEDGLFLCWAQQWSTASTNVQKGVWKVVLVQVLCITMSSCWIFVVVFSVCGLVARSASVLLPSEIQR